VRSNETNINCAEAVFNFDDKPVSIPSDVEDNPIVWQEISASEQLLHISG